MQCGATKCNQFRHLRPSELAEPNRRETTYILTTLSLPPLATLSATKSTQYTSSVCPGRSTLSLRVRTSHSYDRSEPASTTKNERTLSVESLLADTSKRESALHESR